MSANEQPELRAVGGAEQPSLDALAARANEAHQSAMRSAREVAEHARAAGEALLAAKARVQHGEWGPWLRKNVKFSERTARVYMEVARRWPEIQRNGSTAAVLSLRDALYLLATDGDNEAPLDSRMLARGAPIAEPLSVRRLRILFARLALQRPWERLALDVPALGDPTLHQI